MTGAVGGEAAIAKRGRSEAAKRSESCFMEEPVGDHCGSSKYSDLAALNVCINEKIHGTGQEWISRPRWLATLAASKDVPGRNSESFEGFAYILEYQD